MVTILRAEVFDLTLRLCKSVYGRVFFVFLVTNYTFGDGESKHLIFRQGRRFREQRRGRALVPKGLI